MRLAVEPYETQRTRLSRGGRRILAQFDERSIVVYQAFKPEIGRWVVEHGHFGGEFSLRRMSWIKTSFLWTMYRSGWGTKPGQETVLAVRLLRSGFDAILAAAVPSSEGRTIPEVRIQWDPDRTPTGGRRGGRTVQLGLRGETLARYTQEWIVDIEDITPFVREQAQHVALGGELLVPQVEVYQPADASICTRIALEG